MSSRWSAVVALALLAACGGQIEDPPAPTVQTTPAPPPPPKNPQIDPPPPPSPVDTLLVSQDFGAEVQIATSKTGRIAIAWIGTALNDTAILVAWSDDGGATFGKPLSVGRTVGDPILGALDDGAFLVGGLRADCNQAQTCSNGELFLARLPAGGSALEPLPSVFENGNLFIDHPWLAVNGSSLSVIAAPFSNDLTQSGMTSWRSTDRGQTWERSEVVALGTNQVGVPRFCSGQGTRLWASFYDVSSANGGTLRFTDSADQGWTATNSAVAGASDASLVTTTICAASGDTLYALLGAPAASQGQGGGTGEDMSPAYDSLVLVASVDQGKTWKTTTTIDDGRIYLLPELAVEPDGTLDLFAYVGKTLGSTGAAELVRIDPKVATKQPAVVLKDDLILEDARGSSQWLGDYNGVSYSNGKPIFAFGDNSIGSTKIRFARLK